MLKNKTTKKPCQKTHQLRERESKRKKKSEPARTGLCSDIEVKQRKEIISLFVDIKKWLYSSKPQYVLDIIHCLFLENIHCLKRTYIHGMTYHTTAVPHSVWVKKKKKMVGCRPKTSESIQYEWHAWSTEGFFLGKKYCIKDFLLIRHGGKPTVCITALRTWGLIAFWRTFNISFFCAMVQSVAKWAIQIKAVQTLAEHSEITH